MRPLSTQPQGAVGAPAAMSARGGEGKTAGALSGISSLTCSWNSLATTVFTEAPVWCLSGHISRPNKISFLCRGYTGRRRPQKESAQELSRPVLSDALWLSPPYPCHPSRNLFSSQLFQKSLPISLPEMVRGAITASWNSCVEAVLLPHTP